MEFFNDVGGNPFKPSLFELVAQEELRDKLPPALKYVLGVFAQRYPRYLLRLVNKHEEFYAILVFFVERHYLRTHGASFSENFYGLKRRRKPIYETERADAVAGVSGEEKLRNRDIHYSLFFLVAVPYLRSKAQDLFESLGGGVDRSSLDEDIPSPTTEGIDITAQTLPSRLRQIFKTFYPWLNMTYEVWLMGYNVAYLFDRTPFYRPWLAWIGVDLRRLSADDVRPLSLTTPKGQRSQNMLATIRHFISKTPQFLLDSLKVILPMAIFFIKFLDWWYSPSSPARSLSSSPLGPAVPPPPLLPPHGQGLQIEKAQLGVCPICKGAIQNATALPSGYVFCYRCVHGYVERHGRCPVTLLHTRIWQMRKILI